MSVCCNQLNTAMYPNIDHYFSPHVNWIRRSQQHVNKREKLHVTYPPPRPPRGAPSHRIRRPDSEAEEEITRPPPVPKRFDMCQCCYEEIRGNSHQVSTCSSTMHKFCTSCVKRYIETWVYAESYPLQDTPEETKALPCLADSRSRCFLPPELVQNVCSSTVWAAYQAKMLRLMNPVEGERETCSESDDGDGSMYESLSYEDDETVVAANTLHEALTEAKVRRCPQCNVAFLKETGCNRIPCPSCRTTVCYVCLERVSHENYQHFCNHSYDQCSRNCGKCPLWTSQDETMDHQHLIEVSNRVNEAWERELLRI